MPDIDHDDDPPSLWKSGQHARLEVQLALEESGYLYGCNGRVTIEASVLRELVDQIPPRPFTLDELKSELKDLNESMDKLIEAAQAVVERHGMVNPSTAIDTLKKMLEEF